MSGPLKIGVIGCGGIAQMMHLPTLAERPDLFEIVAIADVDPATLHAVGDRYKVGERHLRGRDLAADPRVEAVLLSSSGSHEADLAAALDLGRHVFVEKPLGFSLAETKRIAVRAEPSDRVLMVGYHKRFDPAFLAAKDAVRAMGDLRFVDVTVLHPDDADYRMHHAVLPPRERRPFDEDANARATRDLLAAGPIAEAVREVAGDSPARRVAAFIGFQSLIHDVNLVRAVLGEPERVISASAWRGGWCQSSLTRFSGDVHVSLSWIFVPGLKHYEETIRFVGNDGRVTLTFPSPYLRHHPTALIVERMDGGALVVEHRTLSYEEAFRAELHHFRACVHEGRAAETGLDDAIRDARWLEAIAGAFEGCELSSHPPAS